MTKEQKDLLKKVLGRDSISLEIKHVQGVGTFRPTCQVLFISNKRPEDFPIIASDRAFMDKLTVVEYKDSSIIKPEHQIASLKQQLNHFMVDLFNWAMTAPERNLKLLVRSVEYQNYHDS
jgi:hypothetical protein